MTIDTISGFHKLFALIANSVAGIERKFDNRSKELEWRRERQRTRKQLLKLSDEQLRDIGISKGDADAEGCRPFWD